jgi:Methyltransferase domain
VSATGREPDPRLELPFDQYQRYWVAAELLRRIGVGPGARVLEVGGAPGPLEAFMPEYTLVVSDVQGKQDGRYLLADGAALPFPDGSFDVVLALDVLEHVPAAHRGPFLAEARRVAADVVLLSAPFADPELELAEEALNEFIRARFQGDFPTLDEHADNGLPVLDSTVDSFDASGWAAATLPSGYLPHWLAGMLVHHELLATGVGHLGKLHAYYNLMISPLDQREPAYRHVVVASETRSANDLAAAVEALRTPGASPVGSAALTSIASTVLTQRLEAVAQADGDARALAQARTTIDGLERTVADRDARLLELSGLVEELRTERNEAILGERDASARAWLLGIPYVAKRVRGRLAAKKGRP